MSWMGLLKSWRTQALLRFAVLICFICTMKRLCGEGELVLKSEWECP